MVNCCYHHPHHHQSTFVVDTRKERSTGRMTDSQTNSELVLSDEPHALYALQNYQDVGVYVFTCENRPPHICKIGFCTHFGRRFGELCIQDLPTVCIFQICVSVQIRVATEVCLQDSDYQDLRKLFLDLEEFILETSKHAHATGMREEWRHLDVECFVEEIINYVEACEENPCFKFVYKTQCRPEIPSQKYQEIPPTNRKAVTKKPTPTKQPTPTTPAPAPPPSQTKQPTPTTPAPPPSQTIRPHPHQTECLTILHAWYTHATSAHIVQACGVGKALLGIFLLQSFVTATNAPLFLIGVPSKHLVQQMYCEIRRVFPTICVLCVGSVQIVHANTQCTTETDAIQEWDTLHSAHPRIIVTTYASCHKIAHANLHCQFRIADECHHLVQKDGGLPHPHTYTNSDTIRYDKSWLTFWDITSEKTLCLTATPVYTNDLAPPEHPHTPHTPHLPLLPPSRPRSMTDAHWFGQRIRECDRSVKWAIQNNCITDYDVIVMDHTVDDIDTMMEFIFPDKEINDTHNMLFLSALVTLQALVKYKGVRCTHSLIYTNTIQEAETVNEFVRLIIQHGLVDNIPAAIYHQALHSRITTDIETELKRFRQSEYGIVPCAYLLSEGFDMVELDAVTIASPMHAHVRIVQSILRPNRKDAANPAKQAMVMLPTIDLDAWCAESEWSSADKSHSNVRKLLDALHDEDDACESKVRVCDCVPISIVTDADSRWQKVHDPYSTPKFFFNNEEKLNRFKIKMIRAGCLHPIAKKQKEYKQLCIGNRQQNIASVAAYTALARAHPETVVLHPQESFDTHQPMHENVWKGWTDFLGLNTVMLPRTKQEWLYVCHRESIATLQDYTTYVQSYTHDPPQKVALPIEPADYFKLLGEPFSSVIAELERTTQKKKKRRKPVLVSYST